MIQNDGNGKAQRVRERRNRQCILVPIVSIVKMDTARLRVKTSIPTVNHAMSSWSINPYLCSQSGLCSYRMCVSMNPD